MMVSIVSVLYNQVVEECAVWQTLLLPALQDESGRTGAGPEGKKKERSRVILADNSTDDAILAANRRTAETYGVLYLPMQGNKGIPAAYNRAVEKILLGKNGSGELTRESLENQDGWIVLTDQDTVFPETYLSVLTKEAAHTVCDLLVPEVRAGEKRLSPCRKAGPRFLPLEADRPDEAACRDAFFINTGLALRLHLFADRKLRYDERLFLDFADFDMICRLRAAGVCRAGMLPGITLEQNFSGTEKGTAQQALERFRIFAKDAGVFYGNWYGEKEAKAAIRSRALRLCIKYKDFRFLSVV